MKCFLVACEIEGEVEMDATERASMWAFSDRVSAQKFADRKNEDYAHRFYLEYDSNNLPRIWTVGEGEINRPG